MISWGELLLPDGTTLLEAFKVFLGIDPSNTDDDEALNRALNYAGDTMETYLDRVIAKRQVTEQFPHHFGTVVLHNLPVEDPVTVWLNKVEDTGGGWEWYAARGGLAHLTRIGMKRDQPMDWRPYDQVDVVYVAGYDPIPTDLAYGINIVASGFKSAEGTGQAPGGASGDVKRQTITGVGSIEYDVGTSGGGGGSITASGAIPQSAAQMVWKYKRLAA